MASNVIKIIDSQDKVVSQTQVASGKSVTVSAKEGQSYEFVSGTTKRAPDEIKTTREGNNLKVEIKDGDATSTVVVEDYYTNGEGDLIGLAEDGHFYNFVPEEMGTDYMVTDLADGVSSFQALGSEGDSMSPWWLGLPLLALGAAGGGGGSGAANTLDTTAPDAPSLLSVEDNYDAVQSLNGIFWGADRDIGEWEIASDGTVSVKDDGDDTTNVNVTSDGKIITNDNTPTLSGTGEAGTIVRVYDGDIDPTDPMVNLVGETTVDSDGNWTITTNELQPYSTVDGTPDSSPLQNSEHILNVTLTDTAGNVSDPTPINMIVDTFMTYYMGHLTFTNEDLDLHRERSDKNADITATDNHYFTGPFTISDSDVVEGGGGELENIPYQEGDKVYVELSRLDDSGNVVAVYQIGGPTSPTTIVGIDGSWNVTIDPAQTYYNATTETWETLPDGYYTNQVVVLEPSGDICILPSDTLTAEDGTAVGSFGIDTTAPDKPVINQDSSGVTNSQTFNIDVNSSEGIFHYEAVPDYLFGDVKELLFYRDGSTDSVGSKTVSIDGTETINWTDPASLDAEGVYMYQVKAVDVAGNESELSNKAWVLFDSDTDTHSHDLTGLYDDNDAVVAKDLTNMVLFGDNNNETFTLDSVDFALINGKGNTNGGVDTFVLTGDGKTLDIAQTQNFEVYNINGNTLTINGDVDAEGVDHIIIDGTSSAQVDLDGSWSVSSEVVSGYTVYINAGSDDLWIDNSISNVSIA